MTTESWALLLSAIVPAIAFLVWIYNHDKKEKEPIRLVIRLVIYGIISALIAMVLEGVGENILFGGEPSENEAFACVLLAVMVGVCEEGSKLFMLKKGTWKNPNFNYTYDAIVYSAAVSLGFAGFENILYIFSYGSEIAIARALLAVPAHLAFSIYMGVFYGHAKQAEYYGNAGARVTNTWLALLIPAALHAVYDALAMLSSVESTLGFIGFVVFMDIFFIRRVKKEAREDAMI